MASQTATCTAAGAAEPLLELPLARLVEMDVFTPSSYVQQVTDAPAAEIIIRGDDIKAHSYRELGDALRATRGLYLNYDRNYTNLGMRGFGTPGDYNSRILMYVDGHLLNDNLYDQAPVGTDFPLDIDLIERIEYAPGPGAALIYGRAAFFGAINIVTKSAARLAGPSVTGEGGSFNTGKARLSYGTRFGNGAELLVSGSHYTSAGGDLYYPEFNNPDIGNGWARGLDGDSYTRLFAKLHGDHWVLESIFGTREKSIPTASYGTTFNAPGTGTVDTRWFLNATYDKTLDDDVTLKGRLQFAHYFASGDYRYDPGPLINRDESLATWWRMEWDAAGAHWRQHRLSAGLSVQQDLQQNQRNYNVQPYEPLLDDRQSGMRFGIHAQDEWQLHPLWTLSGGFRYDYYSSFGDTLNPRLSLVFKPQSQTAVKLVYGTAFRAPNAYELYYAVPPQKGNMALRPEEISTQELILEHQATRFIHLSGSAFHYRIDGLISQLVDPLDQLQVFQNVNETEAYGTEWEAMGAWDNGIRARASYAWTHTRDAGNDEPRVNSPEHLLKLNVSIPIAHDLLRAALENQFTSARQTQLGSSISPFSLVNISLTSERPLHGIDISAALFNILDTRYAAVSGVEHGMNTIPQDGRTFRLRLTYRF